MKKFTLVTLFTFLTTLIINAQYRHSIDELQDSVYLAKVEVNGSPALIDLNGNYVVRPGIYDAIYFDRIAEGLCPVKRNGKEGFIDVNGNEVIPCKWRWAWKFERGLGQIGVDYGDGYNLLRGYIDKKGNIVVEPKYGYVFLINGADLISTEIPVNLLNFKGDVLENDVFSIRQSCKDGLLLISKNGNFGGYYFVDSLGQKKLKNFYDVNEFSGGYAVAKIRDEIKGNQPGFIDTEGNQYIVGKYEGLSDFSEDGYAVVSFNWDQKGVINNKFEEIIPCIYEEITGLSRSDRNKLFKYGLAKVKKDDKYAIINTNNQIIIPFGQYSGFRIKEDSLLMAYTFNKYEYKDRNGVVRSRGTKDVLLDLSGHRITQYEYEFINDFYKGFAAVKRDGKNGFINNKGEEVISCIYNFDDIVGDRVNKEFIDLGIIRVSKNGKWGLLNRDGELIVPYIYDKIDAFNEGVAVVKQGNKYGAIEKDGNLIVPVQFYIVDGFKGGRLGIRKRTSDGIKAGYIDKEGREVIPCIYDKVYSFKKVSVN